MNSGKTIRLLCIDDSLITRHLVEITLQGSGIEFHGCASSEEAIALMGSHFFDIIVQDIVRPGMDGLRFMHWLRHNPGEAQRTVPVIVTSIYGEETLAQMQQQYGFSACFDPAHIPQRLLPTISSLLTAP